MSEERRRCHNKSVYVGCKYRVREQLPKNTEIVGITVYWCNATPCQNGIERMISELSRPLVWAKTDDVNNDLDKH